MAQDLRKLFKEQRKKEKPQMQKGHEGRFLDKLETSLPKKQKVASYSWLKVAASVLILVGVVSYFYINSSSKPKPNKTIVNTTHSDKSKTTISLGDLSPDLKKIENYYITNINVELANLKFSDDNKYIVDSYMEQLAVLDTEYKKLNKELNEVGPNDQTIEASIKNLQLRLELFKKMRNKLNQLKLSKNEQEIII